MDLLAVHLLLLEQGYLVLEDHTKDFLDLVCLTHYPDRSLCIFYYTSLSERSKACLPAAECDLQLCFVPPSLKLLCLPSGSALVFSPTSSASVLQHHVRHSSLQLGRLPGFVWPVHQGSAMAPPSIGSIMGLHPGWALDHPPVSTLAHPTFLSSLVVSMVSSSACSSSSSRTPALPRSSVQTFFFLYA